MSSRAETSGAERPMVLGFGASIMAKKSVAAEAARPTAMIGAAVWAGWALVFQKESAKEGEGVRLGFSERKGAQLTNCKIDHHDTH